MKFFFFMCLTVFTIVTVALMTYIDLREDDCLSGGICPKGFIFAHCDWGTECVVNEDTCYGRGVWDIEKQICRFYPTNPE